MTPHEVKEAIADGAIAAIGIDANIFDEAGPGFGALHRLKQFAGTAVRFVLPEIVVREVLAHAEEDAEKAIGDLRKALKGVGRSWDFSREKREEQVQAITNGEAPEQLARRRLDAFLRETSAVQVPHKDVNICEVVDDYFEKKAPFGTGDKKAEFPDAIALRALEIWAEEMKTTILVVSKDGDWARYCADAKKLVLVEDLGDALSYFHAEYEGLATNVAARMDSGAINWEESVKSQISSSVEALGFVAEAPAAPYFYDSDVWDVSVLSVSLERSEGAIALRPIERGEDYLVGQVTAKIKIGLHASFDFSTSDSEGDHIPMGSADGYQEEVIEADLILTIVEPGGDAQIDEVDVEIGKQALWVEFDDVEGPDWSED